MTSAFRDDIRRLSGKGSSPGVARCIRICASNYGAQALLAYRFGRYLLQATTKPYVWPLLPIGWIAYFLFSRYVRLAFDIQLHLSATIGSGLYIGHFGNIVLRECQLGRNCSISHSTRVEPSADGGPGPTIGDQVWIGAHARIQGAYRVGDRATVSAAAVVMRDIPPRALCLGDPARVVALDYDNSRMLFL